MTCPERRGFGFVLNWIMQRKSNGPVPPPPPLFFSAPFKSVLNRWHVVTEMIRLVPLCRDFVSCVSQWPSDAGPLSVQLLGVLQEHEEEPVPAVAGQHLYRQLSNGGWGHLQSAGERWSKHKFLFIYIFLVRVLTPC